MLNDFLAELRNNPRLRWAVVLVFATIWLYAVLLIRDSVQDEGRRHRAATQSLARLQAQLAQTEWLSRVEPARTLAVQLEVRLWQAATDGLAQAALQDAINSVLLKSGVTRPLISVTIIDEGVANAAVANESTQMTAPKDLLKVKAKVGFDFTAASLIEVLNQFENHEKQIVVGALAVNKDQPGHVDMELYGYFQKQATPAGKAQNPMAPL